jgi:ferrous iron transport protein B
MTVNAEPISVAPEIVNYGRLLEKEIRLLESEISAYPAIQQQFPTRWLAIKLLEQDSDIQNRLLTLPGGPGLLTKTQLSYANLVQTYEEDIDVLIADQRYQFIHNLVGQVMEKPVESLSLNDKIDRIVTHQFF